MINKGYSRSTWSEVQHKAVPFLWYTIQKQSAKENAVVPHPVRDVVQLSMLELFIQQGFFDVPIFMDQQSSLQVFFIVLGSVQSQLFFHSAYPQRQDEIDEFEKKEGNGETVRNHDQQCFHLCKKNAAFP